MISFKIRQSAQKSIQISNSVFLLHKYFAQIHIDTLKTPNPNFLKFVPSGKDIMGSKGSLDIVGPQYA